MATLLVEPRPLTPSGAPMQAVFAFEHAIAHRNLFGAMATEGFGLSRFSVLPYHLDPAFKAGGWMLDHGQAHHDMLGFLPGWFDIPGSLRLNTEHNFVDVDWNDPEQRNWWIFTNHQDHLIAQSAAGELTFPFW